MNVKDVDDKIIPVAFDPEEIASLIYSRQSELEREYWQIEKRTSQTYEVNSREGQVMIKNFLWRAIEEYGEALEATEEVHVQEELADALHFITGLFVILDKRTQFINVLQRTEGWGNHTLLNDGESFIMYASKVGNCLKMKPWKQTDVLTDETYFDHCLGMYLISFVRLCKNSGLDLHELYKLYWKKSEVNLFRQRSKY